MFISVSDTHKDAVPTLARDFVDLGFELVATGGTANAIEELGLAVERVNACRGPTQFIDLLKNNELQLVINTPQAKCRGGRSPNPHRRLHWYADHDHHQQRQSRRKRHPRHQESRLRRADSAGIFTVTAKLN